MSENRYFTARDIDALIPQLEKIIDHVHTCKARAEELAAQNLLSLRSQAAADVAEAQLLRSQVEFLMEAVQEDVKQIQAMGGITKDLEIGLIDFLGDVDGQDVWLCWRSGETRVRYWHPLDAGYGQRRALPQNKPNSTLH